jgi:hypothetical protein
MDLSTVMLIAGLAGIVIGSRRPWLGGAAGLFTAPLLYLDSSSSILFSIILSLLLGLLGLASGIAGSMFLAGLRGKAFDAGPTYVSGFGVHHPGGLFLSEEEHIPVSGFLYCGTCIFTNHHCSGYRN